MFKKFIHDGPGKPAEEYGGGIADQQNDEQAWKPLKLFNVKLNIV